MNLNDFENETGASVEEFSEAHRELIYYIEDMMIKNQSTIEMDDIYAEYHKYGEFDIETDECDKLMREMDKIFDKGYK